MMMKFVVTRVCTSFSRDLSSPRSPFQYGLVNWGGGRYVKLEPENNSLMCRRIVPGKQLVKTSEKSHWTFFTKILKECPVFIELNDESEEWCLSILC